MIAVLIDAENVQAIYAEQIFSCAAEMGPVTVKEIYGAATALTAWVEPTLKFAIHPNLTIRPSKFKNSSDIALVIGAMDLLLNASVMGIDTVVIASSDSDFSSLSVRLRSAGMRVVGMGTDKANPLWRTACTSFVTLTTPAAPSKTEAKKQPEQKKPAQGEKPRVNPEKAPAKAEKPATDAPKPETRTEPKQEVKPQPQQSTHSERIAVIRSAISEQLGKAERVQASVLISFLNGLPEYRTDQQLSRRKPLNYLLRHFGDMFTTEESADGNTVYLRAVKEGEAKAAQPADEATAADAPQAPESGKAQADEAKEDAQQSGKAEKGFEGEPKEELKDESIAEPKGEPKVEPVDEPILIGALDLPPRVLNSLEALGYTRADELEKLSDQQLMSLKNIGKVAARRIREAIAQAKTGKKEAQESAQA